MRNFIRNWWRGNNQQSPGRGTILLWVITGLVVFLTLCLAVANPYNVFGKNEPFNVLGIDVNTYNSQENALQFIGAFVVVMGFLGTFHRERISWLTLSGITGALLAMAGLLLQIGKANSQALVIPLIMFFYVTLLWAPMGIDYGLRWVRSKF